MRSFNWVGTLVAARISVGVLLAVGATGACSKTNNISSSETTNNSYSMIIGAKGGKVGNIQHAGAVVPEDALTEDVEISFRIATEGEYPELPEGAAGDVYSFEPHGIEFEKEADVYLPRPGSGSYTIWHAAPGGTWTDLGRMGAQLSTSIHTKTLSFSYFVAVRESSDSPPVGGAGGMGGSGVAGGAPVGGSQATAGGPGTGGGVAAVQPPVPLTWVDGWLEENSLQAQGPVFPFADDTTIAGMTSDFTAANACIKGAAAMVDEGCTPTPPFANCYAERWGAAIGLNLNQLPDVDGMAQTPMPFDATELVGFSFDLEGTVPAELRFRVEDSSGGTEYCTDQGIVAGPNTVLFSELRKDCWQAGGASAESVKSDLIRLAWHVPTSAARTTPFDFCVTNVEALRSPP